MFQNDTQRVAVCRAILQRVGLSTLWVSSGPTEAAFAYLKAPLSAGEGLLVRIAWDTWNGSGKVSLAEMFARLSKSHVYVITALIDAVAEGPDCVDEWLDDQGALERSPGVIHHALD